LQKGLRLQSVMALSQFLFLENLEHPLNITPRSKSGYELLKEQALNSISRSGENSININLTVNEKDEFQSLNLILALMAVQDRVEADSLNLAENQRIERFFYTFTGMISSSDFEKTSFWGEYYASFFKKLSDKDQVKTYVYVILLSHKDDNIIDWINKNTEEIGVVEDLLLEHTKAINENSSPRD
jgi:succinate dehydrogenase flavin-adding protein (antitoxin of CptAB toxin-antitoxin module)